MRPLTLQSHDGVERWKMEDDRTTTAEEGGINFLPQALSACRIFDHETSKLRLTILTSKPRFLVPAPSCRAPRMSCKFDSPADLLVGRLFDFSHFVLFFPSASLTISAKAPGPLL